LTLIGLNIQHVFHLLQQKYKYINLTVEAQTQTKTNIVALDNIITALPANGTE